MDERTTSGAGLEAQARDAYLALDFPTCTRLFEAAYAAYRREGNGGGAIRMARLLGFLHGKVAGDVAVMQGWLLRATTLLGESAESVEHGWILLNRGTFEPDREARNAHFESAIEIARRCGDRDLEFDAMAYLGASLVHADRIDEGMRLLDEAMAAVAGDEVGYFAAVEDIFCQLFAACEHARDVSRAEQWLRVGTEVAARRSLPSVAAFCRAHYGALMTIAGRWPQADAELSEAARIWELGYGSLRFSALARLADLRVRQGRLEEAEQLLRGMDTDPDAAVPLASLRLARGELALAEDVAARALEHVDGTAATPLLAVLAEVRVASADLDGAAEAVARLDALAAAHEVAHVRASAALARGRLAAAGGPGDAVASLREAVACFAAARMPLDLARSRLELARAMTGVPEVAAAEANAALDAFEELEARRLADAAAAVLRSVGAGARPGPKRRERLTRRETEVLGLLGHGLSNREIGERLFITPKTVEHHVARLLAKLGMRNRAEAAAFAARSATE